MIQGEQRRDMFGELSQVGVGRVNPYHSSRCYAKVTKGGSTDS